MGKYEVSVVTPFHNVDLDVFQDGIRSMKAQTYGFDNIEWIVVAHNCTPEFKKGVHELLDEYPNVIVKELDNERRTPSSPRNYGLSLATGDYVGFLDGDDSYTPRCFEVVIEAIKRNNAQVVTFRREFELENPDDIPITEIVLWDQMEREILIDREHWDDIKMFSGICGMVTSRVYDRRFLSENNLVFDESVLFGEDYLFNLEAYGRLDRVLYLPQFIGYHYFINSGSLVQSGEKSPETLIAYAKGYTRIFDAGLKYGFYMNAIISRLCVVLARFLTGSRSISPEQRLEIRDILAPYINRTTMMEPSKVYSQKVVKESYDVPREVILDPEGWLKKQSDTLLISDSEAINAFGTDNARTLTQILETNQNTDIGRHYAFWDIHSVGEFRRSLPVTDYSDIEPLLALSTRIGESNILTAEEIASYIADSVADGDNMIFPVTRRHAKGNARAFSHILKNHHSILLPDRVKGGVVKYNDAVYANTTAGAVTSFLFSHSAGILAPSVTSPEALYFSETEYDTRYFHLLFALSDRDADQLVQPKCRWTLQVFEFIEDNWETICDDIASGRVTFGDPLPADLNELMHRFLSPNPERATELREIFEGGFDTPIARRIWPGFKTVYTNRGEDHEAYERLQNRYLGDTIRCMDLYYEVCGSIVGRADADDDGQCLRLLNSVAYYEFIRESDMSLDKKDITTCLMDELDEGKRYELVVTTASGLYRFRTGRVIRIERVGDGCVWFTY